MLPRGVPSPTAKDDAINVWSLQGNADRRRVLLIAARYSTILHAIGLLMVPLVYTDGSRDRLLGNPGLVGQSPVITTADHVHGPGTGPHRASLDLVATVIA